MVSIILCIISEKRNQLLFLLFLYVYTKHIDAEEKTMYILVHIPQYLTFKNFLPVHGTERIWQRQAVGQVLRSNWGRRAILFLPVCKIFWRPRFKPAKRSEVLCPICRVANGGREGPSPLSDSPAVIHMYITFLLCISLAAIILRGRNCRGELRDSYQHHWVYTAVY
jgi:hypothetical protein